MSRDVCWIDEIKKDETNPCRVALRDYLRQFDIDLSNPWPETMTKLYKEMEHIGYDRISVDVAIKAEKQRH